LNTVFGHRLRGMPGGLSCTRIKRNDGFALPNRLTVMVPIWMAIGGIIMLLLASAGLAPRLPAYVRYLYWLSAIALSLRNLWMITRRTRR